MRHKRVDHWMNAPQRPHRRRTRPAGSWPACAIGLLAASWLPAGAQTAPAALVKVTPQVRVLPWPNDPWPKTAATDAADTEVRLTDADALWGAPQIMAALTGRRLIGPGDLLLAQPPAAQDADLFAIVRGPQALIDPSTGQVLGHQVQVVGTARRLAPGRSATPGAMHLRVVHARREVSAGDRLLPLADRPLAHHPGQPVPTGLRAAVLALPDDRRVAGTGDVVVLNSGRLDGLAPGHRLGVHRRKGPDVPGDGTLPAHAQLLVTQVHLHVARALVIDAQDAIHLGDEVLVLTPAQAAR